MIWYDQYPDISDDIHDLLKQGFSFLKHVNNTYSIYCHGKCYLHWGTLEQVKEKIKFIKNGGEVVAK